MKVLYAREISGDSLDWIKSQLASDDTEESGSAFAYELIERTDRMRQYLDQVIHEHVEKWELERIAVLDHVLLRLAICELFYFDDIPPKVTINEAIEIAKKYSTEKSDKFINGVLDAVLHKKGKGYTPETRSDATNNETKP